MVVFFRNRFLVVFIGLLILSGCKKNAPDPRFDNLPEGHGVGLSCGIDAGAYVALMAEVKVDKSTGKVKIVRVVCVQDMGLVVNPEGANRCQERTPQGGGEPAIINMGAVVANAIFDACGARVYQLPMTPERVLSAMPG